jgi:hypothetical protein
MVKIQSERMVAWMVPNHQDEPEEEMIEWLNTCPLDWDGDESGINIACGAGGDYVLASPGDWVVQHQGQWFVVSGSCTECAVIIGAQPPAGETSRVLSEMMKHNTGE